MILETLRNIKEVMENSSLFYYLILETLRNIKEVMENSYLFSYLILKHCVKYQNFT